MRTIDRVFNHYRRFKRSSLCWCFHQQTELGELHNLLSFVNGNADLSSAVLHSHYPRWKHLLKPDKYKDMLIKSMEFLVKDGRVRIFGFCIMSNHLHVVWQIKEGRAREDVQRDFLRFTAQNILFDLKANHKAVLSAFEVNLKDRKHQIWERNPLWIDLFTREVLLQKLEYVHSNPVKAGLCQLPEEYYYSSASFYMRGVGRFNFLTHYLE